MNAASLAGLVTPAALWGGSFLFMRMGAGEFGAVPLAALRVTGAAIFLWPLMQARGQVAAAACTKKHLSGVSPLALATGSQLAAALVLAGPALLWRPATMPTPTAWLAVALLALACTGIAYVLYFRLIAHVGPANAISVTFLIPVFGVLWGWWLLGERVTLRMGAGCAVILLGTALTTGVLKLRRRHTAHA